MLNQEAKNVVTELSQNVYNLAEVLKMISEAKEQSAPTVSAAIDYEAFARAVREGVIAGLTEFYANNDVSKPKGERKPRAKRSAANDAPVQEISTVESVADIAPEVVTAPKFTTGQIDIEEKIIAVTKQAESTVSPFTLSEPAKSSEVPVLNEKQSADVLQFIYMQQDLSKPVVEAWVSEGLWTAKGGLRPLSQDGYAKELLTSAYATLNKLERETTDPQAAARFSVDNVIKIALK